MWSQSVTVPMLEPPTCSISPLALSEEQLGGAGVGRAGAVVMLGELSCSCPDAWLGAAPWHGALWCSPSILALGICLGSAGFSAWQESAWRLCWERFLFTPKRVVLGGFLPHQCTVGFVLSLPFKAGVVGGLCCACWSPALFRGALGMILSFGACCFAALLVVDVGSILVLPW